MIAFGGGHTADAAPVEFGSVTGIVAEDCAEDIARFGYRFED